MKALRVTNKSVEIAEIATPHADGEASIRVIKSGICNTDLEIVRGYAGFNGTIGHEFVGIVESSADTPQLVGKRVVGEINVGCGICDLCIGGDQRHCEKRTVLGIHNRDGAHAEFLKLPAGNLIEVPSGVSDDAAVFAEPLAAACGILERVDIGPETAVAVVGDGKLGLLCAMVLKLRTANVLLIGKHPQKIAIAEKRGVAGVILDKLGDRNRQFDVVVEASGSESGFTTAMSLVRPRGSIVLKSTFHGTAKWDGTSVVVDETSIVGSRCGRLAPAIDLLASNQVNVDDLISDELGLDKGIDALELAGNKGVLKVLLRP